jgi:hypothetical protein
VALSATLAISAPAEAQQRLFRDSWFWGAKGGVISLSSRSSAGGEYNRIVAPTFGGEWLITRTEGALYVAYDHAIFSTTSYVVDASQPSLTRVVDVDNLRRFTLGLMAFPKQFGRYRPYLGAGVGISLAGSAAPQGTFSDPAARSSVNADINERKSGAAPTLLLGVHADVKKLAIFSQASVVTFTDQFILNGAPPVVFEVGVRYNLAPAKERPGPR